MAGLSDNSRHEVSGTPVDTTTGCGRSSPRQLSGGDGSAQPSRPASFAELKGMKMQQLRQVCQADKIQYSGRVTRLDLVEKAADFFGFSSSGVDQVTQPESAEKRSIASMPDGVRDAYRRHPAFSRITSGWSVPDLCKMPHFEVSNVKEYLLFSQAYDGESLRAYKQLRAYQLFDERHIHDIELNTWDNGTHFYFARAKCWPSQYTCKAAHKCMVCIDRERPLCYGAFCRCVSGLGEVCSHAAALLFAMEDFCSRGYRGLQGPLVTEEICKWAKPCSQKVQPVPVVKLKLDKANPGGRRAKKRSVHHPTVTKYDPCPPDERPIQVNEVNIMCEDLAHAVFDCGYLRFIYDVSKPVVDMPIDLALSLTSCFGMILL